MSTEYQLWTTQMSGWRLAQAQNIAFIDITVKSGIYLFAPTWDNLLAYKRGELNTVDYTDRYLAKVAATVQTHPEAWSELARNQNMVFACYCKAGDFCHRHIFTTMMARYLQTTGNRVQIMGELLPR